MFYNWRHFSTKVCLRRFFLLLGFWPVSNRGFVLVNGVVVAFSPCEIYCFQKSLAETLNDISFQGCYSNDSRSGGDAVLLIMWESFSSIEFFNALGWRRHFTVLESGTVSLSKGYQVYHLHVQLELAWCPTRSSINLILRVLFGFLSGFAVAS